MWDFGDGLRFSWVMCGLAHQYGPDYRDWRLRADPVAGGTVWEKR
jgi:hypothetical protein